MLYILNFKRESHKFYSKICKAVDKLQKKEGIRPVLLELNIPSYVNFLVMWKQKHV